MRSAFPCSVERRRCCLFLAGGFQDCEAWKLPLADPHSTGRTRTIDLSVTPHVA